MSKSWLFAMTAVLIASSSVGAIELRPDLRVTQEVTGVDSRLNAPQFARITDETTWQRVWASHLGTIATPAEFGLETIDFQQSMVIAIIDQAGKNSSAIQIDKLIVDDEMLVVLYEVKEDAEAKRKKRSQNAFGFFVVPRSDHEVLVRRLIPNKRGDAEPGFRDVARFQAIGDSKVLSRKHVRTKLQPNTGRGLNITFGADPGNGNHDGVWGAPDDTWNLVSMGTTAKEFMRYANVSGSPIRMRISKHDGAWGVKGHEGIFHSYIYHNCQCVDLEATLLDVPAGSYQALVYAHGDAPNQNANIELVVGEESIGKKATSNDGTWGFRATEFKEGVHYVRFKFDVQPGQTVNFISHRDGSGYSMFNAIQLLPIGPDDSDDRQHLSRR